jgi:hypothetical protein
MERTATLSKCGTYRYRLGRRWASGRVLLYVMLNPSTADAQEDDATIRRCIGFAQAEGFGALEVVNLFAYRTPYPAALKGHGFPVGPENDSHITLAAMGSHAVCVAWGAQPDALPRIQVVMPLLWAHHEPQCLAITRSGFPAHPVRLPKTCTLRPFSLEAIQVAMQGETPTDAAPAAKPADWPFLFSTVYPRETT